MDGSIEIRYAGVVVGRGTLTAGADSSGGFFATPEPLPVGTTCQLQLPTGARHARVEGVVERGTAAGAAEVGMRLVFVDAAASSEPPARVAETDGVPEPLEGDADEPAEQAVDEPPAVSNRHTIAYGVTAADVSDSQAAAAKATAAAKTKKKRR